jgi:RNA-directed DNA polymerase
MLHLRSERCLANILGIPLRELRAGLGTLHKCFREYYLIDPAKPDKRREILEVRKHWRLYLERLYTRLLLPNLRPSDHSHGGVRGRSIITNARVHAGSVYAYTVDISNFFPSIHYTRVYKLFTEKFDCSADVARICTKLCTHNYHLVVGLPTSPILADQILSNVDLRISKACADIGLQYTRYIDDVTITGPFDLEKSGIVRLVPRILDQNGFQLNPAKQDTGRLADGLLITKLRVRGDKIDVSKEYALRLDEQLQNAEILAAGGEANGLYCTRGQVYGRIQFVCSINPGRKRGLLRRLGSVDWDKAVAEAIRRGLVLEKKRLEPKCPVQSNTSTIPNSI